MSAITRSLVLFCGLLLAALAQAETQLDTGRSQTSDEGHFRVSFTPQLDPVPMNRIHTWVLTVQGADGQPVTGAKIVIGGGMPRHNHGLPTAPRMTEELGEGRYRIEGMKFQMGGHWTVSFGIRGPARADSVTFNLLL